MATITICSDFGAPKIKPDTVSTVSPFISHDVMGQDGMIFVGVCCALSPGSHFPLSFHQGLYSSSSFFAIRVVLSAYLRLLIFILAIWTPASASSIPAFLMMYSVFTSSTTLTSSSFYLEPVCCSMATSNCWFLTHI